MQYMPLRYSRLLEPFAGMAAITIATARERRAERYHINDINRPIIDLLQNAIEQPEGLIENYRTVWEEQFCYSGGHVEHFYEVRRRFNDGAESAENMLYLLARCVKGAVRYSGDGRFNQSPDKRRHGTNPNNIAKNVREISHLLKGKADFTAFDYHTVLAMAEPGDLVYMDPPYQGVTNVRDNRYYSGVEFEEFTNAISVLNRKNIDYIISYDGECGGKSYGCDLPASLGCKKILLNAGLSTQATLLGKRNTTFEALYLSPNLSKKADALIPVVCHSLQPELLKVAL